MFEYVPDCKFPTNNQYHIPTLNIEYCAKFCDLPFIAWGSQKRSLAMPGTWHFYVDDYRFKALWDHPERVTATGCRSIVEPNFSIYQQSPVANSIWQVYRKRWLARFWQSHGINVFADLNVNHDHMDINLLGIPEGWTAFATRGYQNRWKDTIREHRIAGEIASDRVSQLLFVVYGGGKLVEKMCGDHGFVWIPEQEDQKTLS